MFNEELARAMAAHRDELRQIYADTLYAVDNLRIAQASISGRGGELSDQEQAYLDITLETIADIQERIEKRIPICDLT
ncbi:MAG: hypothetical protein IPG66_05735 [Hydrogenophilales bacterium]|nr:hypothetical protein [Hydrogenophilales bacterium]